MLFFKSISLQRVKKVALQPSFEWHFAETMPLFITSREPLRSITVPTRIGTLKSAFISSQWALLSLPIGSAGRILGGAGAWQRQFNNWLTRIPPLSPFLAIQSTTLTSRSLLSSLPLLSSPSVEVDPLVTIQKLEKCNASFYCVTWEARRRRSNPI